MEFLFVSDYQLLGKGKKIVAIRGICHIMNKLARNKYLVHWQLWPKDKEN